MQVSPSGWISFRESFGGQLPVMFSNELPDVPVIAPLWARFNPIQRPIYYRVTSDNHTLERVVNILNDTNPDLAEYQPTFAIIVTWDRIPEPGFPLVTVRK